MPAKHLLSFAFTVVALAISPSRAMQAQAVISSRTLTQAVLDGASQYAQRNASPRTDMIVDDSSFAAHLSSRDLIVAVSRPGSRLRARMGQELVSCGKRPHSCRVNGDGVGLLLVGVEQNADSAVVDVTLCDTFTRGDRSDVMYRLIRLKLKRTSTGWDVTGSKVLLQT